MERRDYANALKVSLISSHKKKTLKSKMAPIYWAANHLLSNKTNAHSLFWPSKFSLPLKYEHLFHIANPMQQHKKTMFP
jgi:hypothetical protein